MTIKKPMKAPVNPATPASGGAAIASRLRLDAPDPSAAKSAVVAGLKPAFAASLVALAIMAFLAWMLWKHWEFLMPA